MKEPYRVKVAKDGCSECGHDRQYDIVYTPNDTAQSQTWGDREDAEDIAYMLNGAYARGQPKWISVNLTSQLPAIGQPVLLGNPKWPRTCIGALKNAATLDWVGYLDQTEQLPEGDPTHHMPLIALPEEDDDIPF